MRGNEKKGLLLLLLLRVFAAEEGVRRCSHLGRNDGAVPKRLDRLRAGNDNLHRDATVVS